MADSPPRLQQPGPGPAFLPRCQPRARSAGRPRRTEARPHREEDGGSRVGAPREQGRGTV